MKTAMQELIDELTKPMTYQAVNEWQSGYQKALNDILYNANLLVEKEKEQIITAFEVGYKSCDLDETFEINRKLASGELHYNKTYK
jgi:hypothetical protein